MGSQGQVFADSCLVCSHQCFIHNYGITAKESRTGGARKRYHGYSTSLEIRKTLYKAFEVGLNPEDGLDGNSQELPLCTTCIFKVGQLKTIQNQLSSLERQYDKIREEIAFSIVDIVASNMSSAACSNISNQPPSMLLRKLKETEVGTLQQLIFEKWHESSYLDYDDMDYDLELPPPPPLLPASAAATILQSRGVPSTLSRISSKGGISKSVGKERRLSSISITKIMMPSGSNGNERPVSTSAEVDQSFGSVNRKYETDDSPIYGGDVVDGLLFDEEYPQDNGTGENSMTLPFSFDLAEFSSSMRNTNGEFTDVDEEAAFQNTRLDENLNSDSNSAVAFEQYVGTDSQQNLEAFRDIAGLYDCEFCHKKFIHKYPFRDHLRVHFGDGPRCKICNKIFPKKHNLMLHLRTHSGEKPYVCSVCDKGFADKSNLKVHMRVHTGEKPYKCDFCSMAFSNSSRLVVHRRVHTNEKPFTCDVCNRNFTTRNQLASHRKIHFQNGGELK